MTSLNDYKKTGTCRFNRVVVFMKLINWILPSKESKLGDSYMETCDKADGVLQKV